LPGWFAEVNKPFPPELKRFQQIGAMSSRDREIERVKALGLRVRKAGLWLAFDAWVARPLAMGLPPNLQP
jgi:hypothetical protein